MEKSYVLGRVFLGELSLLKETHAVLEFSVNKVIWNRMSSFGLSSDAGL